MCLAIFYTFCTDMHPRSLNSPLQEDLWKKHIDQSKVLSYQQILSYVNVSLSLQEEKY